MPWVRMNIDVIQSASTVYSGHVLKVYEPGTTTAISIATDKDGTNTYATLTTNSAGVFEVGGNEVLPYIDRDHKWALFANATDATNNTNPVLGFFDNIPYALGELRVIGTLSDALSDTSLTSLISSGGFIEVTGRDSQYDGAGNIYKVVSPGSGVADGGSFIADTIDGSTFQLQAFWQDIPKAVQYGADEGGAVDSRAALFNMDADFNEYRLTDGTYKISSNLTLSGKMHLDNAAIITVDSGVTLNIDGEVDACSGFHFAGLGTVVFKNGSRIKLSWFANAGAGTTGDRYTGWTDLLNRQLDVDNGLNIQIDGHFSQSAEITQGDTQGIIVWGDGRDNSSIQIDGAFQGWTIKRTTPNETVTLFYNWQYRGNTTSSLENFYIDQANSTYFQNMWVRDSTTNAISLNTDSNGTMIENVIFDGNIGYDVFCGQDTVATKISGITTNQPAGATGGFLGIDKVGNLFVRDINFNGFSNADAITIEGSSGNSIITVMNLYGEAGNRKILNVTGTATIERLFLINNNMQSSGADVIDFNNGQTHKHIIIDGAQNSQNTGRYIDATGVETISIKNIATLPAGTVDGASGVTGRTINDVDQLIRQGTYSYNPAITFADGDVTPDVETGNVFIAANTAPTTITQLDNAIDGQPIWVYFSNGNTTLTHDGVNIALEGSVNKTFAAGDTCHLIKVGAVWREISRSIA